VDVRFALRKDLNDQALPDGFWTRIYKIQTQKITDL